MFKKLLKHDLKAVFKYWWIAAASSILFAVLAGICIKILKIEYTEYNIIYALAILGFIICVIGLLIFPIMNEVIILVRLYKHFFTDEGYLTFTLPVKKSQLLNSKILMSFITNILTVLLLIADIFLMLIIGTPKEFLDERMWKGFFNTISSACEWLGMGFTVTFIVEIIAILLVLLLLSTLIIFACLTVASIITRKHKVITAIALYYAVNSFLSIAMQVLMIDGSFIRLFGKISLLGVNSQKLCVSMILLTAIGLFTVISTVVYILENWLLDRKLNLE